MTGRLEWLWVLGVVAAAAIPTALFTLDMTNYTVMPDELGYMKAAAETGRTWLPVVPGDFWFNSWSQLSSVFRAPFYGALSTPDAFHASLIANAVVMASTAVPVYLLARRVTGWHLGALLAAAISVAIPWLAMAGTLMTEPVAYPATAWAFLAMVHSLERPGWRADTLLLAALAAAFFARSQLIILVLAFVLAWLLHSRAVRAHWLPLAVGALAAVVVIGTGSVDKVLGNYASQTTGELIPAGTFAMARDMLTHVAIGVAVLPVAVTAAWIATTLLRRGSEPAAHAAASVALSAGVVVIVTSAAFVIRGGSGLNDRYVLYLVPLLAVGTLAGLAAPRRWFAPALAATGIGTALLLTPAILQQAGATLISPTLAFHQVLNGRSCEAGQKLGLGCIDAGDTIPVLAAVAALIVAGLVALGQQRVPRRGIAVGVALAVTAYGVGETGYTFEQVARGQSTSQAFLDARDWADEALPEGADAAALVAEVSDAAQTTASFWDAAFWNKSVRRTFTLGGGADYGQAFYHRATVDPESGRVPALDGYEYLLRASLDSRLGLRGGRVVGSNGALSLVRATRPYRAVWHLEGADPNGGNVPPGTDARLRVWSGGAVTLVFSARTGAVEFEARSAGVSRRGTAREKRNTRVRLPLERGGRAYADVRITVPAADAPDGSPLQLIAVEPEAG